MAQPDVGGWQSRKTLADCNRHMFDNDIISFDVTFLVGELLEPISAHKYVLVSRSSVFQAMFCGPLAETDERIAVPDVSVESFSSLLRTSLKNNTAFPLYRYLYYDEVEISPESVLSMLYVAKKYAVNGLEEVLISWLVNSITTESLFTILDQALLYGDEGLKEKCLRFIDCNCVDVLSSDEFRGLSKDALIQILSRDSLETKEDKVIEAVLEWSRAECIRRDLVPDGKCQRQVLGAAIYLVRFLALEQNYFEENVQESGILTDEEIRQISRQRNHAEMGENSLFTSKSRESIVWRVSQFDESVRVSQFDESATMTMVVIVHKVVHPLVFSCDKPILIHGFSLYCSPHIVAEYNMKLTMHEDSTFEPIVQRWACKEASFYRTETSLSKDPFPVLLPERIPVAADAKVRIVLEGIFQNGIFQLTCRLFMGTGGKKVVENHGHTFTFHELSRAGNLMGSGQIAEIIFSPGV